MSERRVLELTRAGNPILREIMPRVIIKEIISEEIQKLIADMQYTNEQQQRGVGLAAPQVGRRAALSIIDISSKSGVAEADLSRQTIINPRYEGVGDPTGMWEGCLSIGSGDDTLYGETLRFKEINAEWYDERGKRHRQILRGFLAHVFQHETDHLNGILFVDKVQDTTTFMMQDEYAKRKSELNG